VGGAARFDDVVAFASTIGAVRTLAIEAAPRMPNRVRFVTGGQWT